MNEKIKYFDHCKTEPQVKKEFRKLSAKHSPRTLQELNDKSKTELMQEINEQRSAALRRIAVSEGRAPSYYEELMAKAGTKEFGSSIFDIAAKIEKDLPQDRELSFSELFNKVSEGLFGTKKELPGSGAERPPPAALQEPKPKKR